MEAQCPKCGYIQEVYGEVLWQMESNRHPAGGDTEVTCDDCEFEYRIEYEAPEVRVLNDKPD